MNVTPVDQQQYLSDGVAFKSYGGEGKGHPVGNEELGDLVIWLEQAMGI
jgi:hypothetical protein